MNKNLLISGPFKLTTTNFRCHQNSTWTFPEKGLILIEGPSGASKTSIFSAIVFCLYGKIPGRYKSPYYHGKTTCSVVLEYKNFTITRQASPKNIVVLFEGKKLQGEFAQDQLNHIFGVMDEFLSSCYALQKDDTSILSATPAEQQKMIRVIANLGEAEKVREKINNKIKDLEGDRIRLQATRDHINKNIESKTKVASKHTNLTSRPSKEIKKDLDEIENKVLENEELRKNLEGELRKSRSEASRVETLESRCSRIKIQITQLASFIKDTVLLTPEEEETKNLELEEMNKIIETYRELQSIEDEKEELKGEIENYEREREKTIKALGKDILSKRQLDNLFLSLERARTEEEEAKLKVSKYKEKIAEKKKAEGELLETLYELSQIKGIYVGPHEDLRNANRVEGLTKIVTTLKKSIEYQNNCLARHPILVRKQCPHCKGAVCIDQDYSITLGDPTNELGKEKIIRHHCKDSIKLLADYVARLTRLKSVCFVELGEEPQLPDIGILEKTYKTEKIKRIKYKKITSESLPEILTRRGVKLSERQANIPVPSISLNEAKRKLSNLVDNLKEQKVSQAILEKRKKELSERKTDLDVALLTLNEYKKKSRPSQEIEKDLSSLTRNFSNQTRALLSLRKEYEKAESIERHSDQLSEIKNLVLEEENLQKEMKENERDRTYCLDMISLSKKAEILVLQETIDSINLIAAEYLESFFEDPIDLRLVSKESVIEVQLEYRGQELNSVDSLSGGERQRCNIAFLLAINEVCKGKVLLLDECFNNLDESLNSTLLSIVKEKIASKRLVLVVSHEAIGGIFDKVIEI